MPFLFTTAIDTRAPLLAGHVRADQMDRSGHYARWEDDFELAHSLGIGALFYGPAYYRAHIGPDQYDWDTCAEPMERLRLLGIEPIADLCHGGVPSWLDGVQDEAFPVLFAEYARAFARRFPWVRYFAPVHDIVGTAEASTLDGRWNDGAKSDAAFARAIRTLCLAHELAVEAIIHEQPDAIIVHTVAASYAHAAGEGARAEADRRNARRWLALDLCLGRELAPGLSRLLHAHGVPSHELSYFRERRAPAQRMLSLAWTPDSERRVTAAGRETAAAQRVGVRHLATELHRRHGLPLLLGETHAAAKGARSWLRKQWDDTLALRAAGIPIVGFGWSPLTDAAVIGTGPRAMEDIGLADTKRALRPAGELFRELVAKWSPIFDAVVPPRAALRPRRSATLRQPR